LRLLNAVLFPEELSKNLFNRYHLLLIQAKDKSYRDITSDTIIFAVKDYYLGKKDIPNAALAAFYCGRVRQDRGEQKQAFEEFLKSDEYGEKSNNTKLRGLAQSHIGEVLMRELLETEAIEHLKTAARCFRETEDVKNEIVSYQQIGNACLMNSLNDSAFYYYNKGLRLAEQNNDSLQTAKINQNLGVACREIGSYQQANEYFRKATEFASDSDDIIKLYLNLSKTFYDQGLLDSAEVYVNKSVSLLSNTNDIFVAANIFKTLSEIAENRSDFRQALEYHKKYDENLEMIVDENKNKEILELKQANTYERLRNENYQMKIRNQQLYISFSIVFLITGLFALFFYKKSADNKKLALEKENQLMDAQNKIYQLMEMEKVYDSKTDSLKNLLLRHFDIIKKVLELRQYIRNEDENSLNLVNKFTTIVYGQESLNWERLYQDMNNTHNGLINCLKERYPALNETEFRVCCLTYAGFSGSEIGIIMGLSPNTVNMKRTAIRKLLKIEAQGNIQTFLQRMLES